MSIENMVRNATEISVSCFEKLYLSYSSQNGWEVRKLNGIQRIFRWFLGMYTETHLATIQSRYKELCLDQMFNLSVIKTNKTVLDLYLSSLYIIDQEKTNQIAISNQPMRPSAVAKFNGVMDRLQGLALLLENLPSGSLVARKTKLLGSQACSFYATHCTSLGCHNTAAEFSERAVAYLR